MNWREVNGFENYLVSDSGIVKNKTTQHVLKQSDKHGYMSVQLSKNSNGKQIKKNFYVHRLVATAFLPNEEKFPQVNHIDRNTRNNAANNLEWCTAKYNINYLDANKRRGDSLGHPVVAINLSNKKYRLYSSFMAAAQALEINHMNIVDIVNNRKHRKSAKGYTFVSADSFRGQDLDSYVDAAVNTLKPYSRIVIGWQLDNPDHKITFKSVTEAAMFINGHESGVRNVLKGKYKQTKGWKFVEAIGEKLNA